MGRPATGPLVAYNVLSACVMVVETFLAGVVTEEADLVRHPLRVTGVLTGSVVVGGLCLHLLTGAQGVRKWQAVKGAVLVLLSAGVFHALIVLYGAPFVESVTETFYLSFLLAVLTVLPSCVVLGADSAPWVRLYAHNRPETVVEASVQLTSLCSLVGAWLGAFPIPLDWDRPWQVWPVTCVGGAALGNIAGHVWSAYTANSRALGLRKTKLG